MLPTVTPSRASASRRLGVTRHARGRSLSLFPTRWQARPRHTQGVNSAHHHDGTEQQVAGGQEEATDNASLEAKHLAG